MIIKSCDNVSICPIGIKLRVKLRLGRGQERMYVQTSEEHRVQDYAWGDMSGLHTVVSLYR